MKLRCMWILLLVVPLAAQVTLLEETPGALRLHVDASDWQLQTRDGWTVITGTDDMLHPSEAGQPDLPWLQVLVAVPPGGGLTATAQPGRTQRQSLAAPLRPVPRMIAPSLDGVSSEEYVAAPPQDTRALGATTEVMPDYNWRGYTLVPVRIRPFTYDAAGQSITRNTSFDVEIAIWGDTRAAQAPEVTLAGAAQQAIVNWNTAQGWRSLGRVPVNYADFSAWPAWVRLEVPKDGIYELTYANLSNKLPLDLIDPAELRLFSTGGALFSNDVDDPGKPFSEVPILVQDGNDGSFDAGDRILFYGRCRDGYGRNDVDDIGLYFNPYSGSTVYWLTYGADGNAPLRIATTGTQTHETTRLDEMDYVLMEDENYRREDMGFEWYMDYLKYNGTYTTTHTYTFQAKDVVNDQQQRLSLGIQEEYLETFVSHNHQIYLSVNGEDRIDYGWSGTGYKTVATEGNFLHDGTNTIVLTVDRTGAQSLYLDHFIIRYNRVLNKRSEPSVFQVRDSDADEVVRYVFSSGYDSDVRAFVAADFNAVTAATITPSGNGFSFTAQAPAGSWVWVVDEADILSPSNVTAAQPRDLTAAGAGVEAIIIAPEEFMSEAEELAGVYQSTLGLSTLVTSLDDVFEQFSGGMPDPRAIRGLVKWVYSSSPEPVLGYLTLLGAGVTDWRNNANATTGKDHIIVWQISTTSSDDYFAYVNNSSFPEVAVGRYPAWTSAELRYQLDHTIDRMTEPENGWWTNRLLFIADDQHNGGSHIQIDHTENAQENSEDITRAVIVDKIMAIDYELDAFQNKPQVRDLMIDKVNEGYLVWYYTGHGGPTKLGDEDYLTTGDVSRLDNGTKRMPLFIAASCSVGKYDLWTVQCLAEQLVLQPGSGAIASLAASCESSGGSNTTLMGNVLHQIIDNRLDLGSGLVAGKMQSNASNARKYILFGDPAVSIVPPPRFQSIELEEGVDSVKALQTAHTDGDFGNIGAEGECTLMVFDSDIAKRYIVENDSVANWTETGARIFQGKVSITDSQFGGDFVVPYEIEGGEDGRILALYERDGEYWVAYKPTLSLNSDADLVNNPDAPHIDIWLGSKNFLEGDPVSASPLLIAAISDSNGVNTMGKPGHKILARAMQSDTFIDVTDSFVYDLDSHTRGEINWQLEALATGPDSLEMIAFDNLNRPSVARVGFTVSGSGGSTQMGISRLLPYPNPLRSGEDFHFTFLLTQSANVTIDIYTITGRKIQTLRLPAASSGYNQVPWDGRDADGDKVANNTYLYRVRAKGLDGGGAEEVGKVMVLR